MGSRIDAVPSSGAASDDRALLLASGCLRDRGVAGWVLGNGQSQRCAPLALCRLARSSGGIRAAIQWISRVFGRR